MTKPIADEYLIPTVVRLPPEQLRRLLAVQQMVNPEESWDKTIGDAIDIALDRYAALENAARVKHGGPSCET